MHPSGDTSESPEHPNDPASDDPAAADPEGISQQASNAEIVPSEDEDAESLHEAVENHPATDDD